MKNLICILLLLSVSQSFAFNHLERDTDNIFKTDSIKTASERVDDYLSCLEKLENATNQRRIGSFVNGEKVLMNDSRSDGFGDLYLRTKTMETFKIDLSQFKGNYGEFHANINGTDFVVKSMKGNVEFHDLNTYEELYKKKPTLSKKFVFNKESSYPLGMQTAVSRELKSLIGLTSENARLFSKGSDKRYDIKNSKPLLRCHNVGVDIGDTSLVNSSRKALGSVKGFDASVLESGRGGGNRKSGNSGTISQ